MAEKLNRQLRQWSWWSRVLAATVGVLVALALASYFRSSTTEARTNMRSILDAISNESAAVTNEYLGGPETAAAVVAGMVQEIAANPELEQRLFANLISATPQVDAVFVGFPDGTFRFVARSTEPNASYRMRTIAGTERLMTESLASADLTTLSSTPRPDDTYDPRSRPWYTAIAAGAESSWSNPYVFSSSKQLGVTYSVGVLSERNELLAVVGVDLTLDDLVDFLKERRPSEQGSAQVVSKSGLILAGSSTVVVDGEPYEPATLPPTTAALLTQTHQAASTFIDGDRWGNVRTVSRAGNWFLLVEAPEADFGAEQRGLLSEASAVIVLAALLTFALALAALRLVGQRVLRLNNMATFDDLTGLWNRAGVLRQLSQVLANRTGPHNVLVAILDLDRFKAVNDSHGHIVGDLTLRMAAHRVATIAEQYGMHCGRLGGDEFVLFGQPKSDAHASRMWGRIEHAVTSITEVSGAKIDLGVSIGVVVLPNSIPVDVTTALHLADRALYAAKREGGNRTVLTSHVDGGSGRQVIDISTGRRVPAGKH